MMRTCRASIFFFNIVVISAAPAEMFTYGVDAGLGATDNVRLVHDYKIGQTIAVTDWDLDYKKKSARLDVDAKGSFSYLDYLQNAYPAHLFGRFDGLANVALVPQRLTWALQENFGQTAVNPFVPTTPSNIENVNYLATGPDLYLRLGGASFLDASARVARTQYETTPFTNTRTLGSLGWGLKLSPLSSVSLNGDSQQVRFNNTMLNTNFERTDVFGRYELQGARSVLSVEVGATAVSQSGTSTKSPLAKFSLTRRLSTAAKLSLTLGHDSADSTTSFSSRPEGAGGVTTGPASNTSETYTRNYGTLGWDYERNRTELHVIGRWERDAYAGQSTLDRKDFTGEARLQRLLSHNFTVQLIGLLDKSDYENAGAIVANGSPNHTTGSIGAVVVWRHGRALELKLTGQHTAYTTSPNDNGYRDNRVFLTVGYRPFKEAQVEE